MTHTHTHTHTHTANNHPNLFILYFYENFYNLLIQYIYLDMYYWKFYILAVSPLTPTFFRF